MLSNLGNVTDPPWSGWLGPVRMGFTAAVHMPRGLSVAALTADGQPQVGFRYRHALLSGPAADRFVEMFAATLEELTGDASGVAVGATGDPGLSGR
jgi:hypothetical protein